MNGLIPKIKKCFEEGVKQGATHMLIIHDTITHRNHCVYVEKHQSLNDVESFYLGLGNQSIIATFDLSEDMEAQIAVYKK